MTVLELVERDFRRAENNLVAAMKRPNIPAEELKHIEQLVDLRAQIVELVRTSTTFCPLAGDGAYCHDCIYGADYHLVNGECVRREDN
jgi:hypothetical protein